MENKLCKKDIIKILILIAFPIIVYTAIIPIYSSDELYNFQSVCKMVNGFAIYKDFNVIVTPMFFYVGALLQKIFGNYILVFRIYSIIILYLFYTTFYVILRKFNVRSKVATTGLLMLMSASMTLIFNSANYNVLSVLFYLIGTLLAINQPSKKNSFFIGLVAYLTFMTKQNVGVFFVLALIISQLFCYKKQAIKHILIQLGICALLIGLSMIVLMVQDSFDEFVNYAFSGLPSFAQENLSIFNLKTPKIATIYIISAIVTVLFLRKAIKEKKIEYYKLFIFAIMLNFITIPIFNTYHIFLSVTLTMAELVILMNKLFDKGCSDEEYEKRIKELHLMSIDKMLVIMDIILYFVIVLTMANILLLYQKPELEKDINSPFFLTLHEEEMMNCVEKTLEYIKENKNVIVFSDDACLYTPILKTNNGILDLPFRGNLGKEGTSALKEKLDNLEDAKILLEEENFCQIPEEMIDYIKNNYTYEGEMEGYLIYSK